MKALLMNNQEFIPVNTPLLNGNEKKYLNQCIESGWISSEGPYVKKFEQNFAKKIGRKHGIAVTNGTAAIDAAICALDIKAGDEVIVPAFTIISCVLQIIRNSAVPVLVDCKPNSFNIDTSKIEEKITSKTKAILVAHIYGLPVEMKVILSLAKKYKLKVIEDTAEALGQTYYTKPCGSFGNISTFSFYPNKHITTGEGGMIVTNNDDLAEECRSLRNLCFQTNKRFVHERLGWNLRMTNLQAAVGLAQLERLDTFIAHKRFIGQKYNQLLTGIPNLILPELKNNSAENIYWVYPIILSQNNPRIALEAMKLLEKEGIGTRPFFCPLHKQPILKKMGFFHNEKYPISEKYYTKGFYIPSGLGITEEQIVFVSKKIWEIFS